LALQLRRRNGEIVEDWAIIPDDMKLHLDDVHGANRIVGYGRGYVMINAEKCTKSVIVTPARWMEWPPQVYADITLTHLEMLAATQPEIALLGTGARQWFLDPLTIAAVHTKVPAMEIMDTGAACRTYNILLSEGRNVAAALLIIQE
jgi:uncharacterized protein